MSRSAFARSRCATPTPRRINKPLHVESLEDRRLLSVNGMSAANWKIWVEYYNYVNSDDSQPYQSLESLLNTEVDPIAECPGLHDDFCLPDEPSSNSVDEVMEDGGALNDDWFSVDSGKQSLLQ